VHSVSAIVVLANSNENNLTTAGIKTTRKVSDLTKHRSISKHQKPSFHITNHPTYDLNNQLIPIVACEHGCIYCFARPSHAYLDLLLGLDFETKVTAKTPAVSQQHKMANSKSSVTSHLIADVQLLAVKHRACFSNFKSFLFGRSVPSVRQL
jgi:hypothetical protein